MELNQTGGMIDEPFTKDIQFILFKFEIHLSLIIGKVELNIC